ncbi:UrcA family protein [Glycocaulis abyssi]|uniref:UrcA family protein n=1 Tax=Glycocaulis abyssi TaxID=1433403 RepID=A0ABV9NC45_9PROT
MKALPLMLAAIVAISVSAPSFAAEPPVRSVSFDTSELRSAEGRQAVEERLELAARQVCRQPGLHGLARHTHEARCRENALQDAYAELDARGYRAASAPASAHTAQLTSARSSR